MSEQSLIEFTRDGHLARVTINRPEVRNALSLSALLELRRIIAEISVDEKIWTVLLSGSGEQSFCAGADLKERRGMNHEQVRECVKNISGAMNDLANLPQVCVAYLNGYALGGGCELALACDLRVMHPSASMGLPETGLAIIPGAGGCVRLPRLLGVAKAKELIFLGRRLDATQALAAGLVNLVGDGKVVEELLEELSAKGPIALRAAKSAIEASFDLSSEEALKHEAACYEKTLASSDRVEALAAFAEKRVPKFEGK